MKATKFIMLAMFITSAFLQSCYATNTMKDERPSFRNMWLLKDDAALPPTIFFKLKVITKFNNKDFDSLHATICPNSDFYGYNENSFVIEGDTLLIGLRYTHNSDVERPVSGIVLVDSSKAVIKRSRNEYYGLSSLTSYKDKIYMAYVDEYEVRRNPRWNIYWNLLFSTKEEIADSSYFFNSLKEMTDNLISQGYIRSYDNYSSDVRNFFFTPDNSFVYIPKQMSLYQYDIASKSSNVYHLPQDNSTIKSLTSKDGKELDNFIQFQAVINGYIVFSSVADWVTIIVDTKTDKVYVFKTDYICDALNIRDTYPLEGPESWYQIFASANRLYWFVLTKQDEYYLIQMELSR